MSLSHSIFTILFVGGSALADPPNFAIIDLGDLGEEGVIAWDVNADGRVVGRSDSPTSSGLGFGWERGTMHALPFPWGDYSVANSVNDLGAIAGEGGFLFNGHAALWDSTGTVTVLIPDDNSQAFGINDLTQVVGQSETTNGPAFPFLWDAGAVTNLGDLGGGGEGEARAINNSTEIVGWSRASNGRVHAFHWSDDNMTELIGLSEYTVQARDINASGTVAGYSDDEFFLARAVIWESGVVRRIDSHPQAGESYAEAINNAGEVVGMFTPGFEEQHAFLYRDGEMFSLDEHLPRNSDWNLAWAYGINDVGMIVGFGHRNGAFAQSGFVVVPVHSALTLAQPSPGLSDENNTLVATGATPGNRIYFVYGTRGGGTIIPTCDLADAAVQIDDAKIAGSAIADGTGTATLTAFVPAAASNLGDILIQAVDPATCTQSQLVVEVFE